MSLIGRANYKTDHFLQDSLQKYTYQELRNKYDASFIKDTSLSNIYFQEYRRRGKITNDSIRISKSYLLKSRQYSYNHKNRLIYLDSALLYGNNIDKKNFIENIYNRRGIYYEENGSYKAALQNYITALEYAKENDNEAYIYATKHNIALIKRHLSKYEESIHLFRECLKYQESIQNKTVWDSIMYLQTFSELISTYRSNNQLDSARILNRIGMPLAEGKRVSEMFELNDAFLDYYEGNHALADKKFDLLEKKFDNKDEESYLETYDLIDFYVYRGMVKSKLGEKQKGIDYFLKVDSIFKRLNYTSPKSRLAYMGLIKHYKSLGDYKKQLFYINELLSIDSVLVKEYKSTNEVMLKDFDTRELLEEKEILIETIRSDNKKTENVSKLLVLLSFLTLLGFLYQYRKKKAYAARFKSLIGEKNDQGKNDDVGITSVSAKTVKELGVPEALVEELEKKLAQFEENLGFLNLNITTNSLAKDFNTNSKYLSKTIHHLKGKKFITYINDLRIEYALKKLKEDPLFRRYTIKAISEEMGFNNSQSFSSAFFKKTGIYPSFYIDQLNKMNN
ncbi:helix-turn-helix domain-containing protein [Sungkyunkwania multivorans]|uniref:Helix-turn-helix domain-containing protein n=1 Tax=Sungkyunkwania multivorans TaxID=1173618 RepID=A0ABW3D0J6_9FLAO